jgi:hypothetical protein
VQPVNRLIAVFNLLFSLIIISPARALHADLLAATEFYADLVDTQSVLHELKRRLAQRLLAQTNNQHQQVNAIKPLEQRSAVFNPTIRALLLILATLRVTSASAKRSFSTLRKLETYLRSAMIVTIAFVGIHWKCL